MYKTKYYCVNCKAELSRYEKMHSYGRCPRCGYKSDDAGTIVATDEKIHEVRTLRQWFQDKLNEMRKNRIHKEWESGYDLASGIIMRGNHEEFITLKHNIELVKNLGRHTVFDKGIEDAIQTGYYFDLITPEMEGHD